VSYPRFLDNLPEPGVIAQDIVEDLQSVLDQFQEIAADLGEKEHQP